MNPLLESPQFRQLGSSGGLSSAENARGRDLARRGHLSDLDVFAVVSRVWYADENGDFVSWEPSSRDGAPSSGRKSGFMMKEFSKPSG